MAICNIKLILLITSLILSCTEAKGRSKLSSTKEEVLNKPGAKSIKTKYGDIYDCINFYKQAAFDHPLLKNHTYNVQVKPSSYPKELSDNGTTPTKASNNTLDIWSNGKGCPVGTVPIRRRTKDDLMRAQKHPKTNSFTPTISGQVHAVIRTTNLNKLYNGAGAYMAIYNPHVSHISQYSSARMKLRGGSDSVEVGWTVNPTVYGDNRTRLFTYLNAGQSHCYNTLCPGFVIANSNIPLDFAFPNISVPGWIAYNWKFNIHRDMATGDWWLHFGDNDAQVGFWPKTIFNGLSDLASYIDWGGEVYSPPDEPAPYMGSGHPPYGNADDDAYFRRISVVNEVNKIEDATDTEQYVGTLHYYAVMDWWDLRCYWGHVMVFGGGLWHDGN